jgi:hypothetical protein
LCRFCCGLGPRCEQFFEFIMTSCWIFLLVITHWQSTAAMFIYVHTWTLWRQKSIGWGFWHQEKSILSSLWPVAGCCINALLLPKKISNIHPCLYMNPLEQQYFGPGFCTHRQTIRCHFQEHRGGNFIAQFIIELLPPAVQQCLCLTSRRTWLWICWNKCLMDEMQGIWHQEVMYIALELFCWRCWQGEGRWTRIGQVENRTW